MLQTSDDSGVGNSCRSLEQTHEARVLDVSIRDAVRGSEASTRDATSDGPEAGFDRKKKVDLSSWRRGNHDLKTTFRQFTSSTIQTKKDIPR